jgi:alginate O-acetyltransferase complex protein AlgI
MSLNSFIFIFYFLPVFLLLYHYTPGKRKNVLTLVASGLFYLWGTPQGFAVLCFSVLIDFMLVRSIHATAARPRRKLLASLSVAFNILILFYFKYSNFFVSELSGLLSALDVSGIPWEHVVFPLGISFITFHKISYAVDVYRRKIDPSEGFLHYANYILVFPKLLQGPITRYQEISGNLRAGRSTAKGIFEGIHRFCIGLAKKILIADILGETADAVFGLEAASMTPGYAWLGALCYTFQIYFDFSGYTDMALGIGRMMGITFPENFNRPYIARNFTEFWRRWHITLSGFFKEYLYIPLGGNRVSPGRRYLNLWTVFLVSGLWHGANWTFIVWGAYHGFFMTMDKAGWIEKSKRLGSGVNIALTFLLVMIGWVFFRAENISFALQYLQRMFDVFGFQGMETHVLLADLITNRALFTLALAGLLSFFPESSLANLSAALKGVASELQISWARMVVTFILFALSFAAMVNGSFTPYLYLRF